MAVQQIITLSEPNENERIRLTMLGEQLGFGALRNVEETRNRILIADIDEEQTCHEITNRLSDEVVLAGLELLVLSIGSEGRLSEQAYHWVARVRNQGTARLIAFPTRFDPTVGDTEKTEWVEQLRALGFLRADRRLTQSLEDDDIPALLMFFDIRQYKNPPDWLNARHWAHPELWNKYRW